MTHRSSCGDWSEAGGAEAGADVDRARRDGRACADAIRVPRNARELPCRGSDPDLWFDPDAYPDVARVCAACPFLRWCATEALTYRDSGYRVVGMWATVDFTESVTGGGYRRRIQKLEKIAATGLVPQSRTSGKQVPAVGTTRRLQALTAIGYSQAYLCERLQIPPRNASPLFRGDRPIIRAATARKVVSLFAELQSVPGPDDKARRRAARRGWQPPPAWDLNSIDDPAASPNSGRHFGAWGGFSERERRRLQNEINRLDDGDRLIAKDWTARQAMAGDRNGNRPAEAAAASVPA